MKKLLAIVIASSMLWTIVPSKETLAMDFINEEDDVYYQEEILVNPSDFYGYVGEKTDFSVVANGNVTYRWYISKDAGKNWSKCWYDGYSTSKLAFQICEYQYGYMFQCKITGKSGNIYWTDAVGLYEKETQLIDQTETVTCNLNDEITIGVNAEGNRLEYRWFFSANGGEDWYKCCSYSVYNSDGSKSTKQYSGYDAADMSFVVNKSMYKYLYRCRVKDRNGNVFYSDNISLLPEEIIITEQPQSVVYKEKELAKISVKAEGEVASYAWFYSKNNGVDWNKCGYLGYKTSEIQFEMSSYHLNYCYKCKITDYAGNEYWTEEAKIVFPKMSILTQPVDCLVRKGETASFSFEAYGEQLRYRWYYSKDKGESWQKCYSYYCYDKSGNAQKTYFEGYDTNTLSFKTDTNSFEWMFKCIITDKAGDTVETNIVLPSEKQYKYFTYEENEISNTSGKVILSSNEFWSNFSVDEKSKSIVAKANLNYGVDASDITLLKFNAKALERTCKVCIKVNGKKFVANYYLGVTKSAFIIPITGVQKIETIQISIENQGQMIEFENVEVVNLGNVNPQTIEAGVFTVDDNYKKISVDENAGVGFAATDILATDDYLYAVSGGMLIVYSTEDVQNPKVIGRLDGLGAVREIAINKNDDLLAISSRENGVFLVDVSEKSNPAVLSNICTQGLATGICLSGNYCFIACRRFGVEIYDISDPQKPTYSSIIYGDGEEFYDCNMSGHYLYVSSWAEKRVHIYDVEHIQKPILVTDFYLSGCGAGMDIVDGYLYVATGYNSKDSASNMCSPGYGMGNGLEIYDINDPQNPKWCSTTKIDGRYFFSGFDHWRVTVSNGLAFYTNVYNGVFVIDVNDKNAPIKLENIVVDIPQTSSRFRNVSSSSSVFPYDTSKVCQGIITSVTCSNGVVYFASSSGNAYTDKCTVSNRGLYLLNIEEVSTKNVCEEYEFQSDSEEKDKTYYSLGAMTAYQECQENEIWDVEYYNGQYWCASANDGITVYDETWTLVNQFQTEGPCRDIAIVDSYIYSAELGSGLNCYSVSEEGVWVKIAHLADTKYNASVMNLESVPSSNFLFAQMSWTKYAVIDISEPSNPTIKEIVTTGTMYDRNFAISSIESGTIGVFDKSYVSWYACENQDYSLINKLKNTKYKEQNGVVYNGEYAITIANDGYVYYDPYTVSQGEYDKLAIHKIDGISLKGMPYLCGDKLIISNCYGGEVTILDITNLEEPQLIGQITVEGNPELIKIVNGKVLVPLRHNGVLVIE